MTAATIRIFLADGTPLGIRVIEKSNWTGRGIDFARPDWVRARARDDFGKPGVYVLTGVTDDGLARVYIGEADVLGTRINQHFTGPGAKEFWTRAVAFTSKDENLNKAHVRYLESRLVSLAQAAKRAKIENGTTPAAPSLSESDRAEAEAFLDEMLLVYPLLGVDAFTPPPPKADDSRPLLYLKGRGITAQGRDTEAGFVVYQGSRAAKSETPPCTSTSARCAQPCSPTVCWRQRSDTFELAQDYTFNSPSTAAAVMLGRSANGPDRVEGRDRQDPQGTPRVGRGEIVARTARAKSDTGANLGFEAKLWQAADALRNNMDAAEYKHVVLGLIFLKYISDAFEAQARRARGGPRQWCRPRGPRRVPCRQHLLGTEGGPLDRAQGAAPQPTIGTLVDDAMDAHRAGQPVAQGRPAQGLRPPRPRQGTAWASSSTSCRDIALGAPADRAKDTLGRVYEYFLAQFASAEGKQSGQFYTPARVVRVLVEMLAPYKGRVYDPCCGSGGMFVQSERFIESHAGRIGDISIYGQESNYTTWRLAKMNLAIRGIDAQIGHGDTFHNDRHPDLKADYVLANPPFNDSDWRGDLLKDDRRWAYGMPPAGNANFAWVQHFI